MSDVHPAPKGLRLVRARPTGRAPAPPFGLRAFDDASESIAVMLGIHDSLELADLSRQLPDRESLAPRTLVVVLADADGPAGGLIGRLFRARPQVPRALRGSALLVRGYTRIAGSTEAGQDGEDLVWGYA